MPVKYHVVATLGTYEKDGQKKYISKNVGSVIETKHGFRLKIDASFNPAGCPRDEDGSVWLALFEPKPRDNQQQSQGQQGYNPNSGGSAPQHGNSSTTGGGGFDEPAFNYPDDIPFAFPHFAMEMK